MGDIDGKLRAVNEKIKKEVQMRQAAERVKNQTTNPQVVAQCEQNIVDAARNIDYLQKELERLQIRQRNSLQYPSQPGQQPYQQTSPGGNFSPISPHHSYSYPQPNQQLNYSNVPARNPSLDQNYDSSIPPVRRSGLSNLDLIKSDAPFARQKISLKLHELEFKLDVERRLKEGSERMSEAVLSQDPKNKKGIADVQIQTLESKEKISLLTRSLQKYRSLYIVDEEEDDEILPRQRRPVTGKLDIRVRSAQHLAHAPMRTSKSPETTVVIKIDGSTKGKTKTSRNDRWNEDFEIHVEKASEIEITLYDKPHEHPQPIGLLWIKISDIAEELRKKRIEAESGPGWVTASNAQFEMQSSPTSAMNNNNGPPYSIPYSSAQPQQGAGTAILPDGIEAWFDVEPVGQILLKLNFVKETANKRPDAGLGRQGAFRKRKGEVHKQNGHNFIQQIFYQIMKCAYCEELFVNEGYQCDDCKLTCHKRCYTKLVTKCITMSHAEMDSDYKQLNHRIPHRFEPITSIIANWCCHCGYILPLGKKGAKKCTDAHSGFRGQMPVITSPIPERPSGQQSAVSVPPPKDKPDSVISATQKVGLDDFNFLAVLGKGNFGKVMLAEEKYTKNLYAIKVLKKEFIIENDEVESTRSEKRVFQAANRERHPFLLGLHSCFQTETRIYFVMEYVSGGDLMLHIQREQFTYRRAQFYAAEVLLALEYLHKQGIIYRDLKLDNILLTLDGHIKIADYGLCKENMGHGDTTNTFCGTPEFMAPEILLEQRYGRAVDWWAFGVLIYEMLLGQSPFRGDDEDEIFDAILEDEILYPINMSRDSVSILQKLLTRDPERRLGSGKSDAEEIKRHPFFKGVNWDDMLAKKVPPPFYPTIASPTDTSNFDEEFTKEEPVLTPVNSKLTMENQEEFTNFSYVSDWVYNGQKQ
ncbi:23489_t:CDS:10 [Dentiscutata erythropus]|uniref:protein kinase C n=1 Tax=Dentiscutata erythropus TaxID=1348616 RepID=A0A9N9BDU3_9GLOM|nr:23489_t:CDS:10 [Dentiscutata erythropus]